MGTIYTENISGSSLSGSEGVDRTYTLQNADADDTITIVSINVDGRSYFPGASKDYEISTNVVTFHTYMDDAANISLVYVTDVAVSSVYLDQMSADCGEIYDALDGGTTAAASIYVRAQEFVKLKTGTTAGYSTIIRPLADAMLVNQVMGGVDAVNKTIGSLSVGDKDLRTMRNYFMEEMHDAAKLQGFSMKGLNVLIKDSAQ